MVGKGTEDGIHHHDQSPDQEDGTVIQTRVMKDSDGKAGQPDLDARQAENTRVAHSAMQTRPITGRVRGGTGKPNVKVGTIIDERFVLEKVLGRGGMSVVYQARDLVKEQARDPNPFGAIKILSAELSEDPQAWIALQREAKKAQALAHPRIATVHDFQVDRKLGLPFAYMEELSGQSLASLVKSNPKGLENLDQIITIILSIADGLDCAHRHSIVHSDLKPSNIFLTEDKEIKILDFGIARAVPGSDQDEFDAGAFNALTPAYATCEMFEGAPPHPSDDLYALGVIAYELLTGHHPYQKVLAAECPALAAREAGLKPVRPSRLSRRYWSTLERCLVLDRENRPLDAAEFLSKFRRRSSVPTYLAYAMLVLCGIVVWAMWFREVEMTPTSDFEDLSLDQQQQFKQVIEDGWTAYQFRDYNGALTYFIKAHEIHPHNPDSEKGLDKLVDDVLSGDLSDDPKSIERKLHQVNVLLKYEALSERGDLIRYREKLVDMLEH